METTDRASLRSNGFILKLNFAEAGQMHSRDQKTSYANHTVALTTIIPHHPHSFAQ